MCIHFVHSESMAPAKIVMLETSGTSGRLRLIDPEKCWNLYGLGLIINCEISNKSQKPIHVSKRGCGNSLVPPCLLKWR
jgi:hypothetical protein